MLATPPELLLDFELVGRQARPAEEKMSYYQFYLTRKNLTWMVFALTFRTEEELALGRGALGSLVLERGRGVGEAHSAGACAERTLNQPLP